MDIVLGIIIVAGLLWLFSKLKKANQNLNDYYPYDPRK
jgi:hypothetical protein